MNLRTVQRWLATCIEKGFVDKKHNKYSLSINGKRELRFREYAHAYGTIVFECYDELQFPYH